MPKILSSAHGLGHLLPSRPSSPQRHANTTSACKPIEEETLPKYNPNAFYPTKIDDVLHSRYKVVAKLGYGMTATVWLAKDLNPSPDGRKYVTIKINVNTLTGDWLQGRQKIAERLSSANPNHPGYQHVRFMLDTFKLKGPHGQHLCVVYDVLREPIGVCMEKLRGGLFSGENLRQLLPALLNGLDYLHSECHVVHTDLKADNIMMGIGDPGILDKFVQDEMAHPSPRKPPNSHGRIIYQSRDDFGNAPTDKVIASAKITDIGLAEFGDRKHTTPIQSNAFTAPEVILTAGWTYPADIWNFGVMLWDLFENFGLFDAIDTRPSHYRPEKHLGLMIALMGPPPKRLLARGSKTSEYFDIEGNFKNPRLIPADFSFESAITRFRGDEKVLFIDFVKKMICWLPEERWTAKQLLEHPWLGATTDSSLPAETSSVKIVDVLSLDAKNSSATVTSCASATGTTSPSTPSSPDSISRCTTKSKSGANTPTHSKTDPNASSENLIRAILERK